VAKLEDDEITPEKYGAGVVEDHEARGWHVVNCGLVRAVGWA
jgi:hypothetical protein